MKKKNNSIKKNHFFLIFSIKYELLSFWNYQERFSRKVARISRPSPIAKIGQSHVMKWFFMALSFWLVSRAITSFVYVCVLYGASFFRAITTVSFDRIYMGHWLKLNWSHSINISRPFKWWKITHNAAHCWQNVCNYLLCE